MSYVHQPRSYLIPASIVTVLAYHSINQQVVCCSTAVGLSSSLFRFHKVVSLQMMVYGLYRVFKQVIGLWFALQNSPGLGSKVL